MAASDKTSEALPLRRAALLLHGLTPEVRSQVVARLDAQEQSSIQPLLRELIELGMPRTAVDESHVIDELNQASPQQRAARLDADLVARALQSCAVVTVAHLLRAAEWPWKATVLERMPESRRVAVLMSLQSEPIAMPPAVLQALSKQLCIHAGQLRANDSPRSRVADFFVQLNSRLRR
ncbi:MAG TPA: hypothetical protein VIU34_30030 [Steroidobacter sp.]